MCRHTYAHVPVNKSPPAYTPTKARERAPTYGLRSYASLAAVMTAASTCTPPIDAHAMHLGHAPVIRDATTPPLHISHTQNTAPIDGSLTTASTVDAFCHADDLANTWPRAFGTSGAFWGLGEDTKPDVHTKALTKSAPVIIIVRKRSDSSPSYPHAKQYEHNGDE